MMNVYEKRVSKISKAAQQVNKPVGMFVANAQAARHWKELGVNFFAQVLNTNDHYGFRNEQAVMNS
ncbi:hypothetical protein OH492_17170 [Vibrio chagasii]|nr:hypothetical protein [Vibrio chagasii]